MKRTFLARRNALFTAASFSWGAVALIAALIVLIIRLLLPDLFWYVFSPLLRGGDAIATAQHTVFSSFADAAAVMQEKERLADDNRVLMSENQMLAQKLTQLSTLLGASDARHAGADIVAAVVARPPVSAYDILVLDKGARDGVTPGMEVFGPGSVPLGVVSAATADYAQVALFSSPGMTTEGWVGPKSAPVTIVGAGGGAFTATVPRSAGIAERDVVFVPGPGQLPLGTVARVDSDPSSPSVTLRIAPRANLFSLAWVALRATGAASFSSLLTATSSNP